jgi:hypothetical protein
MLYLDNGPVAKSGTFLQVMAQLGVEVRTHMPRGSDGASPRERRARSSGRFGRSRKRTRRSIIFTRRTTRPRLICGCATTWSATSPSRTGRSRARGPRTGRRPCRPRASGRCAPGIGSAPSRASRSAGAWVSMPGSRWTASLTRPIRRWPARW